MSRSTSRRSFIQSVAFAGAALPHVLPRLVRAASPNGKLRFAGIGVGGMGESDVMSIGSHPKVDVVALCDIDPDRYGRAGQQWPNAQRFTDYRRMFDRIAGQIDAVNVTTPDHSHALIAMHAMRLGKHVYCQKPLTHTVWEARQMTLLAAELKLVTRMGNQIHSQIEYRLACRMIRDGVIGKITQVHSWVDASGKRFYSGDAPPHRSDPVPAGFDWDLWLGPAASRPFVNDVYHPFKWRAWKDFGGGGLGDFGCHIFDPPFTALELTAPTSILAEQAEMTDQRWPATSRVAYSFPPTPFTQGDALPVYWYDGGRMPDRSVAPDMPPDHNLPTNGSVFVGTKGQLVLPHVGGPRAFPVDLHKEYLKNKPDLGSRHHWHDWVDAAINGDTTLSDNFAYAGPLTETVNLGLIAVQLAGASLAWRPADMKLTGHPDAQALLTREYRKPFEVTPA